MNYLSLPLPFPLLGTDPPVTLFALLIFNFWENCFMIVGSLDLCFIFHPLRLSMSEIKVYSQSICKTSYRRLYLG